jgi:hypothetical protein
VNITRRSTIKGIGMVAVASLWSSAASCSDVFAEVAQYVGVGIQAVTSVVSLLAGAGIISLPGGIAISETLKIIKAAWADVTAAVTEYEGAPAASKVTLGQKVTLALQLVGEYIQKFWTDLSIPDAKLANIVAGLLGIIIATIDGFLPSLPKPPVTQAKAVSPKNIVVAPQKRTVKAFRKDFNSLLAQGGYSQYSI